MNNRIAGFALVGCMLATSLVQAQGTLDHIPPDALGALLFRNVEDLKKKGDETFKEAGIDDGMRPSTLLPLLYTLIGINGADVDETKPTGIVVASPKSVGAEANNFDRGIVLVLPFKDRDKMAKHFGFGKGELVPGQVKKSKRDRTLFGGGGEEHCLVKGSHLFYGPNEKALKLVAATKGIGSELSESQRTLLGKSDLVLMLGTEAWGDVWKSLLRDLGKNLEAAEGEDEKKAAKEFVDALGSVRFGIAGLRVDKGIGLSVLSVFPKEGNDAAKKFLNTFRGGDGASSLAGLPEGNVIAAQAARGDGSTNGPIARLFFRMLVTQLLEQQKFYGVHDRAGLLSLFGEIWQRLRGSRVALYRTADPGELGLFSVVGILEVEDPKEFLAELHQLAKFGNAEGIDFKDEQVKKTTEAEIDKLIKDLGHRRFSVRESAALKLALVGEPILPYLEKALQSDDLEVKKRVEGLKREIVQAVEARRKELLGGATTRGLKPSFAFLDKREKMGEFEVMQIGVKLSKQDATAAATFKQLLGPDWNRIRLAVQGKQVIVLFGSDVGLLKQALDNVANGKPGLLKAESFAAQDKQTDPKRKIELHVSLAAVHGLLTAMDLEKPRKVAARLPLSSATLSVEPDRLQVDIWLPAAEIKIFTQLLHDKR